jgi:membrane protease YdiL (CAAX protease family)
MADHTFASTLRKVFWGPDGIRAGWRFLIFVILTDGLGYAISTGLGHVPPTDRILSTHTRSVLTAPFTIIIEIPALLAFPLGALIMSKIERRSFREYGLPRAGAFGKLFWQGVVWGLVMESVEMVAISALGGFSFGSFALWGFAIFKYGVPWALGFLFVGLAEEFEWRGYAQFTLSTGMGFWPSAIVLSALFGAGHLENPGESWVGALSVFVFGLLCCFTLHRTGNLWFAVGLHAAGDFAESFIYSVPDSGLRATGTLLNSAVHGPRWLTGGAVGPEGSVFAFILMGLSFCLFGRLYPAKNTEATSPSTTLSDPAPQQVP